MATSKPDGYVLMLDDRNAPTIGCTVGGHYDAIGSAPSSTRPGERVTVWLSVDGRRRPVAGRRDQAGGTKEDRAFLCAFGACGTASADLTKDDIAFLAASDGGSEAFAYVAQVCGPPAPHLLTQPNDKVDSDCQQLIELKDSPEISRLYNQFRSIMQKWDTTYPDRLRPFHWSDDMIGDTVNVYCINHQNATIEELFAAMSHVRLIEDQKK